MKTLAIGLAAGAAAGQPVLTELDKYQSAVSEFGQNLGSAVAVEGGVLAAGAEFRDTPAGDSTGTALLIDTTTGAELNELIPTTPPALVDLYGKAVDISPGHIVVGSPFEDSPDGAVAANVGLAYVYDRATGQLLRTHESFREGFQAKMGSAVAIDGTLAALGAPGDTGAIGNLNKSGAVYIVDLVTGDELARLVLAQSGDFNARLGEALAWSDGLVVAGAPLEFVTGTVRVLDPDTGDVVTTILPPDATGEFGAALAVSGSTLLVGAPGDDTLGEDAGAAYLYDLATGDLIQKLLREGGEAFDKFGTSVALSGSTAIVGSPGDPSLAFFFTGAAYAYDARNGARIAEFQATDRFQGDRFGFAMDLDASGLYISAPRHNIPITRAGAVYRFSIPSPCAGDFTGDAAVNIDDVDAFAGAFLAGNRTVADCDANGSLNVDDVDCFVAAFLAGCP